MEHTDALITFGERLRRTMRGRKVRNLTLAAAVGVHVKTVSNWLGDKQIPDDETLARIDTALGTPRGWLRYGSHAPAPAVVRRLAEGGEVAVATIRESAAQYGDILTRVPSPVAMPETIPQTARVLIRRFEAEATEVGATEGEVEFIRRVLTMPETHRLWGDDTARVLVGLEALMRGLKTWLEEVHGVRR